MEWAGGARGVGNSGGVGVGVRSGERSGMDGETMQRGLAAFSQPPSSITVRRGEWLNSARAWILPEEVVERREFRGRQGNDYGVQPRV